MNPRSSEIKLCYFCGEKFATDKTFSNHMHTTVVNQISFMQ